MAELPNLSEDGAASVKRAGSDVTLMKIEPDEGHRSLPQLLR
jgi:hypothetical protein